MTSADVTHFFFFNGTVLVFFVTELYEFSFFFLEKKKKSCMLTLYLPVSLIVYIDTLSPMD